MNILITGGVGFIGTNTAIFFNNQGHQVTCVDNFSRQGVDINAQVLIDHGIKIIKANVKQVDAYLKELRDCHCVIHLAGQTAVTTSITNPTQDFEDNLHSTLVLLEAVRQNNPKAVVIYSSTNKVYGDLVNHRFSKTGSSYIDTTHPLGVDESEPLDFISPYGCSKGAADQYTHDYYRIYGVKTIVFRQSCIYGPYQQGVEDQGWVAHFTKNALVQKSITLFGDGYQVRDLLFVDDLINAYEAAINHIDICQGNIYNIGGGPDQSYSLLDVIEILSQLLNTKIMVAYSDPRLGDQKVFISNNQKLTKDTNWYPKTNFPIGLKKLISWQQLHLKSLA